jgi:hypothetical protein
MNKTFVDRVKRLGIVTRKLPDVELKEDVQLRVPIMLISSVGV